MMNQKEGVFNAVCGVTGNDSFDGAVELTSEQRAQVIEIVTQGFVNGEIEMSEAGRAKYADESKLKTYCNGLVSNWLRKDKRLNGGVKHQIKNPGSRAGSGDPVIKELKKMLDVVETDEHKAAVEHEIEKRLAAIKAEKAKSIEIDESLIPDDLKGLLG